MSGCGQVDVVIMAAPTQFVFLLLSPLVFFVQFISSNWNTHPPSVLFVNIEKHTALLEVFFCAAMILLLVDYYFVTCIVRVSLSPMIVSE